LSTCRSEIDTYACDWENRINRINVIKGDISTWHTLNKFAPDLEKDSNPHHYKKDFFLNDFRQMELVSTDLEQLIQLEIEAAKPFKVEVGMGYEKVYVRDKIPKLKLEYIGIES